MDERIERWALDVADRASPGEYAGRARALEDAVYEHALASSSAPVHKRDVARVVRGSAALRSHSSVVSARVAAYTDDVEAMAAAGTLAAELSDFDRRVLCVLEDVGGALTTALDARRYTETSDGAALVTLTPEFDADLYDDVIGELCVHYGEAAVAFAARADDDAAAARAPALWMTRQIYWIDARPTPAGTLGAPRVVALLAFVCRVAPPAAAAATASEAVHAD